MQVLGFSFFRGIERQAVLVFKHKPLKPLPSRALSSITSRDVANHVAGVLPGDDFVDRQAKLQASQILRPPIGHNLFGLDVVHTVF